MKTLKKFRSATIEDITAGVNIYAKSAIDAGAMKGQMFTDIIGGRTKQRVKCFTAPGRVPGNYLRFDLKSLCVLK